MYNTMASSSEMAKDSSTPPSVLGGEQEITSNVQLTVEYK
jgi:hypothetical protein